MFGNGQPKIRHTVLQVTKISLEECRKSHQNGVLKRSFHAIRMKNDRNVLSIREMSRFVARYNGNVRKVKEG